MSNVFADQLPENVKISVTLTPDEFILLVKDNRIKIKAYHAFEYHGVPGCTIIVKT